MGFDENPPSPDKIVHPAKWTTQVNFGIVGGVILFFLLGGLALWLIARHYAE